MCKKTIKHRNTVKKNTFWIKSKLYKLTIRFILHVMNLSNPHKCSFQTNHWFEEHSVKTIFSYANNYMYQFDENLNYLCDIASKAEVDITMTASSNLITKIVSLFCSKVPRYKNHYISNIYDKCDHFDYKIIMYLFLDITTAKPPLLAYFFYVHRYDILEDIQPIESLFFSDKLLT